MESRSKERNRTRLEKLVVFVLFVILFGMCAFHAYPYLEWKHRMKKMLRDAEYVRLYDADGELVATIKDGEEIGGIWIAMDLWNREHVACCSEGDDVGQLTYPTEMELDGQRFHFPIRLHSDGIALWGITPDSRHWFRSSQLTAHVQQLLATYTAVDAATE